ncbi:MAG: recombinase family protein [Deltaproteobacteria bacterium]|nr:recombinase family protein [Deltaproteobacteria bacterium]
MKDYFPGNLGGNDRRFTRPNRPYDTTLTRNLDMRNGNYRTNGYQRKKSSQEVAIEALNENLQVIKEQLQTISGVQQRLADAQERRATAEERNADAMEQIAEHLKRLLGNQPITTAYKSISPETTASQNTSMEPSVDEDSVSALEIISDLRQKGLSYEKIAQHLIEKGIPTPNGKGVWNRKMVSRHYQAPAN